MSDHRPALSQARTRWQQAWTARWQALSLREQRLLRVLAVCLALVLGWQLLIAAPLQSLRDSDARRATLAQSQAQMQVWQAQAQAAQQQPRLNTAEAATLLQTLTAAAGKGWQVQVQG